MFFGGCKRGENPVVGKLRSGWRLASKVCEGDATLGPGVGVVRAAVMGAVPWRGTKACNNTLIIYIQNKYIHIY